MTTRELISPVRIKQANFLVFEGDVERDRHGKILNRLVEKFTARPVGNRIFRPADKTAGGLIVTSGKNLVLDRLFGIFSTPAVAIPPAITSVGVGDSSTAAAASQTGLQGTSNVLIQTADAGTSRTAQTVTMQSTFGTAVANFNWQECGLFNGNTNNVSICFDRIVIGPFAKTSSVSIVISLQITQN